MKRLSRTGSLIAIASIAAVLAFALAIAVSELVLYRIHAAAQNIALTAGPGIQQLSGVRTQVYQLGKAIDSLSAAPPAQHQERLAAVRTRAKELREKWSPYRNRSGYQEETPHRGVVEDDLSRIDVIAHTIRPEDPVQIASAQLTVSSILDHLDREISLLEAMNTEELTLHADEIDRIRHEQLGLTILLSLVAAIATLVAGGLAFRAVRRSQELLEERASELEQFAARVSHDLFNPLWTATVALELAGASTTEPRLSAAIRAGHRGLVRARGVGDAMLAFARAGARPSPGETAQVRAVLEEVVEDLKLVADENDVELVLEAAPRTPVRCSAGLLTSAVTNLVANAIKYMGDSPNRHVTVRAVERGERVRVEVEDTGPGIPPEIQGHLFEPFFRGGVAGKPGVGLGLATVQRIVMSHDGSIEVNSDPGRGSRFAFELPVVPAPG